jgi:hypothetical protein
MACGLLRHHNVKATTAVVLWAAFLVGATVAPLRAQEGNRFALGGNIQMRTAEAAQTHGGKGPGLQWRFGHSETGWGWAYGLNWFATDVDKPIGGSSTELGELRVKPFMGGYGYTRRFGAVAVAANMLGGWAVTSFTLAPSAADAYRDRLGARTLDAHSHGTFVAKPEVEAWIDVGRKYGIKLSAGYMLARPRMTVSSSLGDEYRRVRADQLMLTAGVVYRIF